HVPGATIMLVIRSADEFATEQARSIVAQGVKLPHRPMSDPPGATLKIVSRGEVGARSAKTLMQGLAQSSSQPGSPMPPFTTNCTSRRDVFQSQSREQDILRWESLPKRTNFEAC